MATHLYPFEPNDLNAAAEFLNLPIENANVIKFANAGFSALQETVYPLIQSSHDIYCDSTDDPDLIAWILIQQLNGLKHYKNPSHKKIIDLIQEKKLSVKKLHWDWREYH